MSSKTSSLNDDVDQKETCANLTETSSTIELNENTQQQERKQHRDTINSRDLNFGLDQYRMIVTSVRTLKPDTFQCDRAEFFAPFDASELVFLTENENKEQVTATTATLSAIRAAIMKKTREKNERDENKNFEEKELSENWSLRSPMSVIATADQVTATAATQLSSKINETTSKRDENLEEKESSVNSPQSPLTMVPNESFWAEKLPTTTSSEPQQQQQQQIEQESKQNINMIEYGTSNRSSFTDVSPFSRSMQAEDPNTTIASATPCPIVDQERVLQDELKINLNVNIRGDDKHASMSDGVVFDDSEKPNQNLISLGNSKEDSLNTSNWLSSSPNMLPMSTINNYEEWSMSLEQNVPCGLHIAGMSSEKPSTTILYPQTGKINTVTSTAFPSYPPIRKEFTRKPLVAELGGYVLNSHNYIPPKRNLRRSPIEQFEYEPSDTSRRPSYFVAARTNSNLDCSPTLIQPIQTNPEQIRAVETKPIQKQAVLKGPIRIQADQAQPAQTRPTQNRLAQETDLDSPRLEFSPLIPPRTTLESDQSDHSCDSWENHPRTCKLPIKSNFRNKIKHNNAEQVVFSRNKNKNSEKNKISNSTAIGPSPRSAQLVPLSTTNNNNLIILRTFDSGNTQSAHQVEREQVVGHARAMEVDVLDKNKPQYEKSLHHEDGSHPQPRLQLDVIRNQTCMSIDKAEIEPPRHPYTSSDSHKSNEDKCADRNQQSGSPTRDDFLMTSGSWSPKIKTHVKIPPERKSNTQSSITSTASVGNEKIATRSNLNPITTVSKLSEKHDPKIEGTVTEYPVRSELKLWPEGDGSWKISKEANDSWSMKKEEKLNRHHQHNDQEDKKLKKTSDKMKIASQTKESLKSRDQADSIKSSKLYHHDNSIAKSKQHSTNPRPVADDVKKASMKSSMSIAKRCEWELLKEMRDKDARQRISNKLEPAQVLNLKDLQVQEDRACSQNEIFSSWFIKGLTSKGEPYAMKNFTLHNMKTIKADNKKVTLMKFMERTEVFLPNVLEYDILEYSTTRGVESLIDAVLTRASESCEKLRNDLRSELGQMQHEEMAPCDEAFYLYAESMPQIIVGFIRMINDPSPKPLSKRLVEWEVFTNVKDFFVRFESLFDKTNEKFPVGIFYKTDQVNLTNLVNQIRRAEGQSNLKSIYDPNPNTNEET